MNTSPNNETSVVADDKVPTIVTTRIFDASPGPVFRAHTDPELYARWIGPTDTTTSVDSWDCRTGGAWAYTQRSEGFDAAFEFYGSFHEIRENELIVQTFTFAMFPDNVALERITLTELDDGRTQLVATSLVDSFDTRDAMISSGMATGIVEGYQKLDTILAEESAS